MAEGKMNIELALKFRQKPYEVTLTNNDAILYSLGIGFSRDGPTPKDDLRYTYENADSFQAFPTNSLVVCHRGPFADGDFDIPGVPAFNPMMLLHGEEQLTIHEPIKTDTKYVIQEKMVDLQDKGKGGVMIVDSEITDASTKKL